MYITLHTQELKMCKKIGYKYYCKELFIIKSKMRYSCASAITLHTQELKIKRSDTNIIAKNCS